MKQAIEQLWQQHGEDHFIEVLSDFLREKQSATFEGTSYWTLLKVPAEFDPDSVIEAAYSCRKPKLKISIAELNDRFRQGDASLGITRITRGVQALPPGKLVQLIQLVRSFDKFIPKNDPYDEHDLAVVEMDGIRYFYKIDYYDREAFNKGQDLSSDDPSNPDKTWRVGMLMRADESKNLVLSIPRSF
ncbi:DUF3768 domain-containing protein [Iningainema tapete]|uniref:DUF3768 domain-containing protein n=1 Tax=Iningainema tapete BLCC-T55 TaxID=2748662 RepID=A0A8J7C556_9CYAN|nr:DUF3768 domain-containing protein [Iningainema tapete]MBD2772604.1 DUF3768 domain-containing protein [Iningainema tapete BLCC-T55]